MSNNIIPKDVTFSELDHCQADASNNYDPYSPYSVSSQGLKADNPYSVSSGEASDVSLGRRTKQITKVIRRIKNGKFHKLPDRELQSDLEKLRNILKDPSKK